MKLLLYQLWLLCCGLALLGYKPASGQTAPCLTCPKPAFKKLVKPTIIQFDFECRCFAADAQQRLDSLQPGDMYRLHIAHINPLLYKIAIGARDTSKAMAIQVPSFALSGLGDLKTLAEQLTQTSIAKPAPERYSSKRRVIQTLSQLEQQNARSLINTYTDTIKAQDLALKQFANRLDDSTAHYNLLVLNSRLESQCAKPTTIHPAIVSNASQELENSRRGLAKLRERVEAANQLYTTTLKDLRETVDKDEAGLKAGNDQVVAAYKQLSDNLAKAEAILSADSVQKLLKSLVDVVNNARMEYVSLPQQFSQRQTTLRLHITPRTADYAVQEYHTQLTFPLERRRLWGLSSGFFVSRLYSAAYSPRAVASSAGTTQYQLVTEDPGKFEYGATAMVRTGRTFRDRHALGWQLGFGPALAVSTKVRPRLLAGGGLFWGTDHHLLVDAGVAVGYADKLSAAYDLNAVYVTAPDNPVVSVLRANVYVGLHYLFLK